MTTTEPRHETHTATGTRTGNTAAATDTAADTAATTDTFATTDAGTDGDGATDVDAATEALAGRLFEAGLGAIELLSVYLGLRLHLYEPLAGGALAGGALTADELASRAEIHPRYATEWLEQQTVAGIVVCDDPTLGSEQRRYSLPVAHAAVLLDADHPACMAPLALATAGVAGVLPELLDAYRTGGGVPYARYGTDFRDGQAGFNRPGFVNLLADAWLAAGAPDVHAVLTRPSGARIADVACGAGWSSISIARAYPNARVDGYDIDAASIADARRNAAEEDLLDRVRFEVRDAAAMDDPATTSTYDLVTVFEAVHDMSHPVDALRAMRAMCAPGGTVVVMDERAAETFADADGPIERFIYGASVLHCLPVGMSEPGSAGTGAAMRPSTMRGYAGAAGFSSCRVLPIEHDLFRFYHLVP